MTPEEYEILFGDVDDTNAEAYSSAAAAPLSSPPPPRPGQLQTSSPPASPPPPRPGQLQTSSSIVAAVGYPAVEPAERAKFGGKKTLAWVGGVFVLLLVLGSFADDDDASSEIETTQALGVASNVAVSSTVVDVGEEPVPQQLPEPAVDNPEQSTTTLAKIAIASTTNTTATITTEAPGTTARPTTTRLPTTTTQPVTTTTAPTTTTVAPTTTTRPTTTAPPATAAQPSCHPGYSGCVPIDTDVDCAGGSGNGPSYVRGPIRVLGDDPYDLDRNNDGIACENG